MTDHKCPSIDLRQATREQILELAVPSCAWKDKNTGAIWPAVKLRQHTRVTLWDGREKLLYGGDYIVRCEENPPVYGSVAYFAHETRYGVEPIYDGPIF